jgi:uncharacterized protein with HEPN domain
MVRDPRALLWDAHASGNAIERFLSDKHFEDYLADDMLRSAVERQFEILGEALAQLSKADPKLAEQIPDAAKAIAFRNILIHGYARVDSAIVWQAATQSLPKLKAAVDALLKRLGD